MIKHIMFSALCVRVSLCKCEPVFVCSLLVALVRVDASLCVCVLVHTCLRVRLMAEILYSTLDPCLLCVCVCVYI